MHRSLLLLLTGLLAVTAPSSAIYVEGYEPPTWHDVTFEVRHTADGIEIVLVEGNFTMVQQGHHVNVTVINNLSGSVDFAFLSTWHGDDPMDDGGNITYSTRVLRELTLEAGSNVTETVQLPNDTFRLRFEVDDGTHQAAHDEELMIFLAMSGGMVDDTGQEPAESEDEVDAKADENTPFVPIAVLLAVLVVGTLLVRRT